MANLRSVRPYPSLEAVVRGALAVAIIAALVLIAGLGHADAHPALHCHVHSVAVHCR